MTYNPSQPRDPHGRWTDGGESSSSAKPYAATLSEWAKYFDGMDRDNQSDPVQLAANSSTSGNSQSGKNSGDKSPKKKLETSFNADKFADALNKNAEKKSQNLCAKYVRRAFEAAGGNSVGHADEAKNWGPTLLRNGFKRVEFDGYSPQKGDIVIHQPYEGGNTSGHMAGYDGKQWISDYRQQDIWGGDGYRNRSQREKFVAIYRRP